MMNDQPLYEHDCNVCTYLGRYRPGETDYDLYFCPQGGLPTVIARYSSNGPDYVSGMFMPSPALDEARRRASRLGLVSMNTAWIGE